MAFAAAACLPLPLPLLAAGLPIGRVCGVAPVWLAISPGGRVLLGVSAYVLVVHLFWLYTLVVVGHF